LGLAEAISRRTPAEVVIKQISLRSPWRWVAPGFVPFARLATSQDSDPLEPPWPDLWIGCGRQSLPLSMGVRTWSGGRTFVVQLQDPRINVREFDLVAPPEHDRLEGPNVAPMIGSCHRVTPQRVAEAAASFAPDLSNYPPPTIAVLIGGKSTRQDISAARAKKLAREISSLDGSLLVTLSRRTGPAAREVFQKELKPFTRLYFEGTGPENPYLAMLGAADVIIVTADSANMAVEAAATGKPVLIADVDGDPGKLLHLHRALFARGVARPFRGRLENWRVEPVLETDRVAAAVLQVMAERKG
jgi:mitochondrial fission protein ELM1